MYGAPAATEMASNGARSSITEGPVAAHDLYIPSVAGACQVLTRELGQLGD